MSLEQQLAAWYAQIQLASYYGVLRIARDAPQPDVKAAFHALAMRCHPDRYVGQPAAIHAAASEVFKRIVEAYSVLSKPEVRARYDQLLARGKLRMVDGQIDTQPPPVAVRTLEDLATSPKGKAYARRADMLISLGRLGEARVALASATQEEPDNAELGERLAAVYDALALEPER